MLSWKVILQTLLVIIGTILIFIFFVPRIMEGIALTHPIFYEMEEEFRCHLFQMHSICLSLYPNPVTEGETVEVTFRTRRWHTGEACVAKKVGPPYEAISCCTLTKGKCKTNFVATSVSLTGTYFAFIDGNPNEEWDEGIEPKGEEKELTVNRAL